MAVFTMTVIQWLNCLSRGGGSVDVQHMPGLNT